MKMLDPTVGSVIMLSGKQLLVELCDEQNLCLSCFFNKIGSDCLGKHLVKCTSGERKDQLSVRYILQQAVKDSENLSIIP